MSKNFVTDTCYVGLLDHVLKQFGVIKSKTWRELIKNIEKAEVIDMKLGDISDKMDNDDSKGKHCTTKPVTGRKAKNLPSISITNEVLSIPKAELKIVHYDQCGEQTKGLISVTELRVHPNLVKEEPCTFVKIRRKDIKGKGKYTKL
ncbi:uncharacterized protein A4U43_C05F8570 [Asparagus officinalis]|uniref:Uncharacterized protein n=1 Tax=Asparagus officinalis TaxID=4686 RepID=A0A5P1ETY2_ASPOF|nr:uncharacterized protein A4U43_C05F8570 [Asparagus officinalis]